MITPITLIVWGDPKGQPRPKAFSRGGHARVYDPGTAENYKSQIAVAVKEVGCAGLMLPMPLKVEITCHFKRPKSHYRSGKNSALLKAGMSEYHTSTPDFDNIGKSICDALTHLGVWEDDSLVVDGRIIKKYSTGAARTEIIITKAE